MGVFNLADIMDAIADTLVDAGVTDRAYPYPVQTVNVPCAVVGYPSKVTLDITFKEGGDEATFPVWFVVGDVMKKESRDALSAVLTGAGSIKAALDGDLGGVVSSARAVDIVIEQITIGGSDYLAAKIDLDVIT